MQYWRNLWDCATSSFHYKVPFYPLLEGVGAKRKMWGFFKWGEIKCPDLDSMVIFLISCTVLCYKHFKSNFTRKKTRQNENTEPTLASQSISRHIMGFCKSLLFKWLAIEGGISTSEIQVHYFFHNPINSCEENKWPRKFCTSQSMSQRIFWANPKLKNEL